MGRDLQRSETNCLTTLGLTSCSLLNADRRGAPTTSRGSLFWCLTFQKFFLMSSLSLPWHRFEPFLCALSLDTREKRGVPPSPLPILRELQRGTRSPLSPFLQASQPECPSLLTGVAFQPFYWLCPCLDAFKDLNVLVLYCNVLILQSPEPHAVLQVRLHQG